MNGKYILVDKKPVAVGDLKDWGRWFEKADRIVAKTKKNEVEVSTVFLGLDHARCGGPPLIFETMVFGGEHDLDQQRCSTWEEAEKQHKEMCEEVWGK